MVGGGAIDKFQGKIIETSTYLHIETKNRIAKSKEEEMQLRRTIATAQRLLQKDPHAFGLGQPLRNTMLFRSSAAWWSKSGDKVNKQIFMYKKPRTNCSYKPKLIKEDGSMLEDIPEILVAVTSHYHELLSDNYPLAGCLGSHGLSRGFSKNSGM